MIKRYLQVFVFISCFSMVFMGFSQTSLTNKSTHGIVEGLTIYPNPVSNGKLYISTSKNLSKEIDIFDVLGKKVFSSSLFGNTLDVSKLTSGVYIIKITENNIIATRKLVIR